MNELISAYKEQLPKYKSVGAWGNFMRFSAVVSLLGAAYAFFDKPNTISEWIFSIFLCVTVSFSILYIFLIQRKKYHRYSESILFLQYLSHLTKDFLKEFADGSVKVKDDGLHHIHGNFVESISKCFSLLTGKSCSVCIKRLNEDGEIRTIARNVESVTRYNAHEKKKGVKHTLDDNSDFQSIFKNNSRYFLENNLKSHWKKKKLTNFRYKNSSFEIVGEPKIKYFLEYPFVSDWKLPYRSTLIAPIRYISTKNYPDANYKHFWGFLCIDCNTAGVFNEKLDPELACCFSDLLYVFASQIDNILYLNSYIQKLNETKEIYNQKINKEEMV